MSIKDIGDGWLNFLMTKFFNKDLPIERKRAVEERFNICIDCDNLKMFKTKYSSAKLRFCGVCKCSFPGMIFSKGKKCPVGKWGPMNSEYKS